MEVARDLFCSKSTLGLVAVGLLGSQARLLVLPALARRWHLMLPNFPTGSGPGDLRYWVDRGGPEDCRGKRLGQKRAETWQQQSSSHRLG